MESSLVLELCSFILHIMAVASTLARLNTKLKKGSVWYDDLASAAAGSCSAMLLVETARIVHRRPLGITHSSLAMALYLLASWFARAGLVLSTARLLKTSVLFQQKIWAVGMFLISLGIIFGVLAAFTCTTKVAVPDGIHMCKPSEELIVISITCHVSIGFYTMIQISDLHLKGLSIFKRPISSHKKRTLVLLASVTILFSSDIAFLFQHIVLSVVNEPFVAAMRNVAAATSVLLSNAFPLVDMNILRYRADKDDGKATDALA